MLLAFGERPGRFARHRTTLAGNAAIDVEHKGKLSPWICSLIGILHLTAELPVIDLGHGYLSLLLHLLIESFFH
jgi:hypothetical protein